MPEKEDEDYALGYRHGSDSSMPDTRGVWNRPAYFDGYAQGTQDRDMRLESGEPHIVIPPWMTPAQVESISKLYKRNPDGSLDRHAFFQRVSDYGDYCGISWCGMFIGIEKDGYTHS